MAAVITASEVNRIIGQTQLDQVMDQVTVPSHKWFSLQDNVLDGSYFLVDQAGAEQIGWWGSALSDAGGTLASPPVLTITETRSIQSLQVVGDSLLNEYPVDFTVKLYNGAVLLHTETVVGNSNVIWNKNLGTVYDVTKIDITVSKVNKASRVVKITDAFSPFDIYRSDTLAPILFETSLASLGIVSIDDIKIASSFNELGSLSVQLTSADSILSTLYETGIFTLYELWSDDALLPKTTDISMPVVVSFTRPDSILTKLAESKAITASFTRPDMLLIKESIEDDLITASFDSDDELKVKLNESIVMTNVHTRMNETFRQTYAKVEITYTDPFLDNTIDIIASNTAYNTDASELANGIEVPAYKWFSLTDNKLDGSYGVIDGSKKYSVGWWSAVLSDSLGNFAAYPTVIVTFEPRALFTLKVAGDSKLNNYPVNFEIKCYDNTDTLVHTETVTNNSSVIWTKSIETLLNVTKLVLTISKINKAYDTVKLTEFFTAIVETYYNNVIVDLSLLEELEYPNGSISLGSVSANEIDISLDNSDGRFNLGDTQSPLYNLIKRNRRVRAWLGVEIVPDEIEWYPLGVFWTVGWDIPDSSLEAHTTARDRLELLRLSDFTTSLVYENYSLYQLFEVVLDDAGLLPSDYVLDTSLQSIIIPYAWFDRMSHREALQRLAQCAYIQVFCDRYGKIVVGPIDTSTQVYFNFDNDTNIYSKSYPITASEVTNYVEVSTSAWFEKPLQDILTVNETIDIAAGETVELTYSFTNVPSKNVQSPILTGASDLDVSMTAYAWGMILTLTNNNATSRTITSIVVQGQPLEAANKSFVVAKDDILIRDNGKQRVSVEHDFIQTNQYAQLLATTLLDAYKQSIYDVSIQSRGNIGLFLGQKVQVNDSKMNTNYQYITQRQTINWNGSLNATVDGKKI